MPLTVSRLRQWFASAVILVVFIVLGAFFYARHRVQNALKQVPEKIGINVQQSAQGFTISKSEQGRTLFKLQASKAIQLKQGGRAELHNVMITVYGRDSSRFDQVYGDSFEYDPQSGNVTGKGEVSIDLESNPSGALSPDQTPPKELKNPIHLKTTDLVFNQKTGDGWTAAPIEFRVPQASGSAVGAKYSAKDSVLTLQSQVRIVVNGAAPSTILAEQAVLEKSPREMLLRHVHAESPEQKADADQLTLFLLEDDTLDHATASGNVRIESSTNEIGRDTALWRGQPRPAASRSRLAADNLLVHMKPGNVVGDAVLNGDVHFRSEGAQAMEVSAGKAVLSFGARNSLNKIHADEQAKLTQRQSDATTGVGQGRPPLQNQGAQDVEVTAPAMDFLVADGSRLTRAETIGPPQISLSSSGLPADTRTPGKPTTQTRITADKFTATFDPLGQLSRVHGEAHTRLVSLSDSGSVSSGSGQLERVSTSDSIDAFFRPGTGVETLVQQGHFTYTSGTQQAFADHARYTVADELLTLIDSPRVEDAGMSTTARMLRFNRATGDAVAEGDVRSTYSDLKPQPSGAMLASGDPIHVTADSMTAHNSPAVATYSGNARLWQNANLIEAPSIQFQKDQRSVVAESKSDRKVSTVLVGTDKSGKATPVTITSGRLSYRDSERQAHFEGGVTARGAGLTITSKQMDVFLVPSTTGLDEKEKEIVRGRAPVLSGAEGSSPVQARSTGETPVAPQSRSGPSQAQSASPASLEKIIASGSVLITEPNRRAAGDQLTYTAADDKFVLTGGPPSIFDAEHGKITGVSLTLFRRDDRVVVEGDSRSPAVTQTKVVR
jgi:lipopolysaccharide export system protein LptA